MQSAYSQQFERRKSAEFFFRISKAVIKANTWIIAHGAAIAWNLKNFLKSVIKAKKNYNIKTKTNEQRILKIVLKIFLKVLKVIL